MAKTYGSNAKSAQSSNSIKDREPKHEQRVEVIREFETPEPKPELDRRHASRDDDIVDPISAKVSDKSRIIIIVCCIVLMLVALGFGALIILRSGLFSTGSVNGSTVTAEDATQDAEDMQRRLDAIAAAKDVYAKEEAKEDAKETVDAAKTDEGTVVVPDGFTEHVEGYAISEGVADESSDTLSIKGELINLTAENHGPCAVGYYLYDLDNNVLGMANIATDGIEAGKVWKFTAMSDVPANVVHRFELADVRF